MEVEQMYVFLEYSSSGTFNIKRLKSQLIRMSLGTSTPNDLNKTVKIYV